MDWQPIETAPKMRTILLFAVTERSNNGSVMNWRMETGFWHTGYEDGHNNSAPWNWGGDQIKSYATQPTHWMPLPDPPKDSPS